MALNILIAMTEVNTCTLETNTLQNVFIKEPIWNCTLKGMSGSVTEKWVVVFQGERT